LAYILCLGKPETKAEELKVPESKKAVAKASASAKQVKIVEPKKDNEEDSDDDSDEDDDFGSSDEEVLNCFCCDFFTCLFFVGHEVHFVQYTQ